MKKLFTFLMLMISFSAFSQDTIKPYSFSEIIQVSDNSKTAKTLYANAKIWYTRNFKNPKEVIILDDPENNIIIGRGNIPYNSDIFMGSNQRKGYITFDITIACKDGKYKYNFSNFTHEGNTANFGIITNEEFLSTMKGMSGGPKGYKIKVTNELREKIKNRILPVIDDLKSEMNKEILTKQDW
ncbi:DUF4468 domain-containing protein [Empedobacter brevis]|uniref:DUF4468 domain-containing protein n=1 Tax=Empedobacter brevis TaxID=247 RepID=UPI0033406E17